MEALVDILKRFRSFTEQDAIFVEGAPDAWVANSPAIVLRLDADGRKPANVPRGFQYFFEPVLIDEVFPDAGASLHADPTAFCKMVIHYARNDAYG